MTTKSIISWLFGYPKKPKHILFCWFSEDEDARKTVLGLRGIPLDYDQKLTGPITSFPNQKHPNTIFVFIRPLESEDFVNELGINMQLEKEILSKITTTEDSTMVKMKEFEKVVIICSQNYLARSHYVYSTIEDYYKSNLTIWNISIGKGL